MSARANQSSTTTQQNVAGQTISVKGIVYDDQGAPLPGAGVVIKGTTTGTVTDLDGRYELKVGAEQTLVVSFIGYKDQDVAVKGRTQINVSLFPQATSLDDVVVIGYGSVKKANLTGAIDAVGAEMFADRPAANVDQMLTGNVPSLTMGITDGAPYRVNYGGYQIRGISGISENKAAGDFTTLVLIDGIEGDPNLINPNDIESITVLKDAAATAIYGGRGAQGVILVTTKNPEASERVKVNYTANFNFLTPSAIPDLMTDGERYSQIISEAIINYKGSESTYNYIQTDKVKLSDIAKEYAEHAGETTIDANGRYHYHGSTDWFDEIYKSSTFSQVHNLSINGNMGKKTSYLISGRLYDYDGLYVGKSDPYTTYNLRSKITTEVFPWLKLTENIEYTYDHLRYGIASNGDGCSSPQDRLYTWGAPTWEIYNADGTFTKAGAQVLGSLVGDAADRSRKTKTNTVFGTQTKAEASFLNNRLRFIGEFSYKTKETDVNQVIAAPFYSEIEGATLQLQSAANLYKQNVRNQNKKNVYRTVNAYAEYEDTFVDKLYLKAMAGYNYDDRDYTFSQWKRIGLSYDNAIAGNPFAFATGKDGNGIDKPNQSIEMKRFRNAGVFSRINLGWDDRYLLELNVRYDGSSVFAAGHQWGVFPSGSAAWRVSQEPWWHVDPKWVSALKIRASYGVVGDMISAGAYSFEESLAIKQASDRLINGSTTINKLVYPDEVFSSYTWSTIRKFDIGADASFFNNKLDINYDYFINRNKNMLTNAQSHSDTYGSESGKANCADLSTYGWELTVKYNDTYMVGGKPFHFGVRGAVGHNHTIIDKYLGNEGGGIYGWRAGQRHGEVWGFKSNGLFQTQEEIDNAFGPGIPYTSSSDLDQHNSGARIRPGDVWLLDLDGSGKIDFGGQSVNINEETGKPNYGDMTIIGNKNPLLNFSFGFDFDWNNFFLSLGFQGIYKADWCANGEHLMWQQYKTGYGPMTKFFANNHWTPENPDALFPGLSLGNKVVNGHLNRWSGYGAKYPVDRFLFDVSYLNLQNVQFGYNIPTKLLKKINLSAAKVFFSGENLWNWSPIYNKIGRDFDVTTLKAVVDDYEFGVVSSDFNAGYQYPKLRTFSLGISITY